MQTDSLGLLKTALSAGVALGLTTGCRDMHRHDETESAEFDHDHEEQTHQITAWSDQFEIFAEFEPVAAGREFELVTHVTSLETRAPRVEGPLHLRLRRGDQVVEQIEEQPAHPGIYVSTLKLNDPGVWEMSIELPGSDDGSTVVLPELEVHADAHAAARAELELLRARLELQRSQVLQRQAHVALAGAVGVRDLEVNALSGDLEDVLDLATIESVALDLEKNPAMVAAEATVEEKRARIDLAKAERIPDVKVEALYRRLESREDSVDLGVAIPLPFFDRNQGRLREARAELAAAEARARATAVETGQRLSESHAQLVAALDQARVLRTGVLPLSQTIKTTMERRHQAGEISLAELLPARRDWAAVQLSYLETLRDVMAAWNEVRALTGTL
jgi:hypothetical protein